MRGRPGYEATEGHCVLSLGVVVYIGLCVHFSKSKISLDIQCFRKITLACAYISAKAKIGLDIQCFRK